MDKPPEYSDNSFLKDMWQSSHRNWIIAWVVVSTLCVIICIIVMGYYITIGEIPKLFPPVSLFVTAMVIGLGGAAINFRMHYVD